MEKFRKDRALQNGNSSGSSASTDYATTQSCGEGAEHKLTAQVNDAQYSNGPVDVDTARGTHFGLGSWHHP